MFKKSFIFILVCSLTFFPISAAAKELIPGGENIGIKMEYEGVAVISTYSFQANDQTYHPSKYVNSGDVIIEVNQQKVTTLQELNTLLQQVQKDVIPITIIRNHQVISSHMYYIYDQSTRTYMSGLYLQDAITGIGTITFYDPSNQSFGALGHEILDHHGKSQESLQKGKIYESEIILLSKAKKGIPGEKHASILYDSQIGWIQSNQSLGIFGTYQGSIQKERMETATPKEGKAMIYTVIEGDKLEAFDILIKDIKKSNEKALSIEIIDQRLLNKSGGIIQGMSGSPIIQDGKLVGAVTHVLVNDPTRGYGIFIENMLDAAR